MLPLRQHIEEIAEAPLSVVSTTHVRSTPRSLPLPITEAIYDGRSLSLTRPQSETAYPLGVPSRDTCFPNDASAHTTQYRDLLLD